jgi:hypothetical protein
MSGREIWGSLSVADHTRRRAFVAEVLLFDRLVLPVPPDDSEKRRWSAHRWNPKRQRRLLDILGTGASLDDLAIEVPWDDSKKAAFRALSGGPGENPSDLGQDRAQLLDGLRFDATQLKPDAYMATRMVLTRGYDAGEEAYMRRLPRTYVEDIVPAYATFEAADRELGLTVSVAKRHEPSAEVIGWSLFVPANSEWSDEHALDAAAKLARSEDYRGEREVFRDWWRTNVGGGMPAEVALGELTKRADRLNRIATAGRHRTRTLRSFALLAGGAGLAGVWFPPVAIASGVIALVSVGADWALKDETAPAALAPAAMFTSARKQLGWY